MPSILFVCTANRFRSPLAAAAFLKMLKEDGKTSGWKVASAGTWTQPGLPVLADAKRIALQMGLDLNDHITLPVSATILSECDLILVMELGHKEALETEFPASKGKVLLLSEVADHLVYDVPDPNGTNESSPDEIAREINDLIGKGFQNIIQQAERMSTRKTSLL
jgi:protein-tyrosine phosphatase